MKVQWRGDNLGDIDRLLAHHHATAHVQTGQKLLIRGADGLSLEIDIGDSIILEGDRLGIDRVTIAVKTESITWTGDNVQDIAEFVRNHEVSPRVIGSGLQLLCEGEEPVHLRRGDKLEIRGGRFLCVSRGGQDHRV